MDLFNLVATLGLDTSAFDNALSGLTGDFTGVLGSLGKKVPKWFGKALSWAADATVDFTKDVITSGMEVDKTFSAVQAVLGKGEGTAENMAQLMGKAQEVAADSIFTLKETGDAYYYMGMAGWKTEEMLAGLPGVINLAAASGEDLGQVSDIVTDSLTAFGLGAGQAAHFADVLAATATNTNTDVSRMGQTFKYLAPVAGALGYSIEDIATSIGLVANAGIKGSMAGTSLRNVFTRISTNAGATNEKLGAMDVLVEQLGVDFYDSAGKARPWGEVLVEARQAWKKLDTEKADKVAKAFGDVAVEGQDASEIMSDFANDLDVWTTEWNSFTTEAQRNDFAKKYGNQFEALGISMYNSKGKLREFNDVAAEARIKLGGLTDQEKVYYSQQIGNLRGMTSWLALMNASEADFNQVTQSIENAAGAAQDMANVKLDNLWGDVQMFNSRLDILKYAIFDDVKGPLRDVVQYATNALDRLTDRINADGILGGLEQLGIEIENTSRYLEPVMRSIGKAVAPMMQTVLNSLLPAVIDAAGTVGFSFVSGIGDYFSKNGGVIGMLTGSALTFAGDFGQLVSGFMGLFSAKNPAIEVPVGVEVTPEVIEKAISDANAAGTNEIVIDGLAMPVHEWENVLSDMREGTEENLATGVRIGVGRGGKDARVFFREDIAEGIISGVQNGAVGINPIMLEAFGMVAPTIGALITGELDGAGLKGGFEMMGNIISGVGNGVASMEKWLVDAASSAGETGGAKMASNITTGVSRSVSAIRKSFTDTLSGAGASGGAKMASNAAGKLTQKLPAMKRGLSGSFGEAGNDGGTRMANNLSARVVKKGDAMKNSLSGSLGAAGTDAGYDIASRIQQALSITNFVINVFGALFGGGGSQKFAKAQNAGRILRGATVFGVSGSGEPLIGGENGPEAVIGTNSLRELVFDAASNAVTGVSGNTTINIYQQPGEDSQALAERIERLIARKEMRRRSAMR